MNHVKRIQKTFGKIDVTAVVDDPIVMFNLGEFDVYAAIKLAGVSSLPFTNVNERPLIWLGQPIHRGQRLSTDPCVCSATTPAEFVVAVRRLAASIHVDSVDAPLDELDPWAFMVDFVGL